MTTAPAAFTRVVTGASCSERNSFQCSMPAVVRSPRTLIDSFSVIGSPSNGASSPLWRRASAAWASVFARSKSGSTMALSAGLWRAMRRTWRSSSSTADTCLVRSAASISVAVAKASIVIGILRREYSLASTLEASGAPPGDQIALDGDKEDERGNRDHDARGHDEAPVDHGHVEELVDADGQRLELVLADQHQREEEIVPGDDEREDRGGDDAGQRQGHHDVRQRLRAVGAVDQRGVLELQRARLEEGAQDQIG